MRLKLTVCGEHGDESDVEITAPDTTPLTEVTAQLVVRFPEARRGLWAGARRLPPDGPIGALGLRRGTLVTTGRAAAVVPGCGTAIGLHVVGGPCAGRIIELAAGQTTIGRSPDCRVELPDPQVSRRHASIMVSGSGLTGPVITVRDLGSTNGTTVDGLPVLPGGQPLEAGMHLRVGDSTLAIVNAGDRAAGLRPGADGTLVLNRAFRPSDAAVVGPVILAAEPPRDRSGGVQLLAALLPALAGGGLAFATGQLLFLVFALASPLVLMADRWVLHRSRQRAARQFRADNASSAHQIATGLDAERAARRDAHPDPAGLLQSALIASDRIWQRRRDDPDFLDVRLGLADRPSRLQAVPATGVRVGLAGGPAATAATTGAAAPAGILVSVPVTVNLRAGPIGICGPREIGLRVARGLVGQLAASHSPADVELRLLGSPGTRPSWTWLRWFPHLTVREGAGAPESGTWTVLIVDLDPDGSGAADGGDVAALLDRGPAAGITAIWLAGTRRQLPSSCAAVATVCGEVGSLLRVELDGATGVSCIADQLGSTWAQSLARALAPLRDAGRDHGGAIPTRCRLLEVNELPVPSAGALTERWQAGGRPVATIGIGAGGPMSIDLARDGPHALIAGTTGAGKSELLRSLVTGLALNNHRSTWRSCCSITRAARPSPAASAFRTPPR